MSFWSSLICKLQSFSLDFMTFLKTSFSFYLIKYFQFHICLMFSNDSIQVNTSVGTLHNWWVLPWVSCIEGIGVPLYLFSSVTFDHWIMSFSVYTLSNYCFHSCKYWNNLWKGYAHILYLSKFPCILITWWLQSNSFLTLVLSTPIDIRYSTISKSPPSLPFLSLCSFFSLIRKDSWISIFSSDL